VAGRFFRLIYKARATEVKMIRTRVTDLFGIKHPIMLAGMNWITESKMVAEVSNAGALGILACAHLTPEETRRSIAEIRSLTDKCFGVNQHMGVPGANENISVAIEAKVPVINYSLGKPWFIDQVHAYGGRVMGTVATLRHAIRAEQLGVDAIVVTGHEAAAHADAATSLILIPLIADAVKVPLIAAGGFADGRGLAAALVLGADAVSMGTRFMLTRESPLHDNFKQACLKATEQDTLYSDRFDGMLSRVLRCQASEKVMKSGFPLREILLSSAKVKSMLAVSWWDLFLYSLRMMRGEQRSSLREQILMAMGVVRAEAAIIHGNLEEGILPAGQVCGIIHDIPGCRELIESVVKQAEAVLAAANRIHSVAG
jgi:enoyl-[acyl-carrier protein] reductase II